MPKFNTETNNDPSAKPAMDQIPPATKGAGASIPSTYVEEQPSNKSGPAFYNLSEAAQLAKIQLERDQWLASQSVQTEDWMVKKWRPAMGWTYMAICILDMAVFPVLWAVVQASTQTPLTQWNPLTLQGAGLFHLAMGAVLGIAAWSRGQEKISNAAK